jgi:hypothetical protein
MLVHAGIYKFPLSAYTIILLPELSSSRTYSSSNLENARIVERKVKHNCSEMRQYSQYNFRPSKSRSANKNSFGINSEDPLISGKLNHSSSVERIKPSAVVKTRRVDVLS